MRSISAWAIAGLLSLAGGPVLAQSPMTAHWDAGTPAPDAPAHLAVAAPLAGFLTAGVAVIPYRVDGVKILPVYGAAGLAVVPRVGHLHVTVDDGPWHWVDASGEPVVIQGLPPGPHSVRLDLADANHAVLDSGTSRFVIPPR